VDGGEGYASAGMSGERRTLPRMPTARMAMPQIDATGGF